MKIPFENIDRCLAGGEKALNVLGWVPFVSTISGGVRIAAGKVMVVAFAALAAVAFAVAYALNNKNMMDTAERFTLYVWHGMANIVRGFIESIPLIGNIGTILYDSEPAARIHYPNEPAGRSMIPIKVGSYT